MTRIWTEGLAHAPRLFASDAEVRELGEGLVTATLPRPRWTHEAHIAATLWLLRERPDIAPERDLPDIIRRYNASVGGVNDDTQGYHETVTQLYVRGLRAWAAGHDCGQPLASLVNAALASPIGRREWPLTHYSRERLFSVEARRGWVEPDLKPL